MTAIVILTGNGKMIMMIFMMQSLSVVSVMEMVTAAHAEAMVCCTAPHLMKKTATAIAAAVVVIVAAVEVTENCNFVGTA